MKRAFCAVAILGALPSMAVSPKSSLRVVVNAWTYEPFNASFASRIVSESGPPTVAVGSERHFSPQRTSYIVVKIPDYKAPGPWRTVVWIGNSGEAQTRMLTFIDHASGGVKLQWLNEKLVYGSVWWGRIVATDFIFDVQRGTFIYREMAEGGALVQPCQRGGDFR